MKRKSPMAYIIVCCLLLLRSTVQAQMSYPGVSVALTKDNKVIPTKDHGTRSVVTQLLVNEHPGFRIAFHNKVSFYEPEEVIHHLRFYAPQPVQPS